MAGATSSRRGHLLLRRRLPRDRLGLCLLLLLLSAAEGSHGHPAIENQWEFVIQLLAVAVTNFAMALPIYAAWKAGLVLDVVVGAFALSTSTIYHALQAVERFKGLSRVFFLGGSSLDWQKADNVFAVACFSSLILQPLQITRPALLVGVQGLTLSLSSTAQNVGSWNAVGLFICPIASSVLCLLGGLAVRVWSGQLPVLASKSYLLGAAVCLPLAFACFLLGLNDDEDYLRLKHGMWHVTVSVVGFCVIRAFNPPSVSAQRRAFMLGPSRRKCGALLSDLFPPESPRGDLAELRQAV